MKKARPDGTRTGRHPVARALSAFVVTGLAMSVLTGCFVIPLVDERSPFDDPFGASRADVSAALEALQPALDTVDSEGGAWRFAAEAGQENCEGDCQLHVIVRILPVVDASAFPDQDAEQIGEFPAVRVPVEILRDVLVKTVPIAEEQRVDLRVTQGSGDDFVLPGSLDEASPSADIGPAAAVLFGAPAKYHEADRPFSVWYDQWREKAVVIAANTREHADVLEAMGLL